MPRSSRHKSHKQSKHSLKEVKEYSDSEGEDVKMKESGSGSGRVLKDSSYLVSGEKRKLVLQFKEGKDLSGHGNGDAGEEYVSSKRRKEKADTSGGGGGGGGGDRWIGGGDGKGESGGESLKVDVEKSTKSREIKGESKSKGSKRHESDRKEENVSLVVEKEESRSVSRSESKRKSEKEKDSKDLKEVKDKDRVSEREKKLDGNVTKKQDPGEDKQSRRSRNDTEEELQNLEMEKESEKKTRKKREGSDERRVSSKSERTKRDEKHKEDSSYQDDIRHREKYREESDRDSRRRDEKYREHKHRENGSRRDRDEGEKDIKRRDEKYREDHEDDNNNNRHKEDKHRGDDYDREKRVRNAKYVSKDRSSDKNHTSRKCSSPVYDDRVTRYNKDDLDRRKIEKDDQSRRSASRNADVEHNRRRTSPSSSSQIPRDQYRGIKQEESKYREYGYEDRDRDRGRVGREFSNEKKNLRMNIRNSPMALTEKSPSSRRSLDVEESKEEESVSSPFNRKSILPPPLQYGGGFEDDNRGNKSNNNNNNNRYNNNRRMNDSSHLGRVQGGGNNNNNNWRGGGVPNWTPPMGNGFMPFQHGPPFHHVMHQQNFGPPIFNVNVRPSIDMNHGYSNHVRPMGWRNSVDDSLHNWDSNNNNNNSNVFVDDSNLPYWDNNNGRNWENNRDIWKGQNSHESSLPPQQVTNEESQPYVHEDVNENKVSEEKIVEAPKISHEETLMIEEKSIEKVEEEENDDRVYVMYLKKLDISSDLIEPEVSDLLLDLDMEKGNNVICDVECKGFLEHEALEDRVGTIKAPLFSASDECVFQKAMNLYKKQKGELKVRNEENLLALSIVKNDGEKVGPNYSNEVEGSLLSNASMEVQVTSDVGVDNVEEEATVEDTMMIMMNGHDLPADNNKGKEEECEVVMNESIESEGVVNLSGIHSHSHSPESTR